MVSREVKFRVIYHYRNKYAIRYMCSFFEVSKSAYYRWQDRLDRPDPDKEVAEFLRQGFTKSNESYGYAKWTVNYIKGDANGDGKVDALDLLKVKKHLLWQLVITGDSALAADVTGDGKIDALDLLKIKKYLLGQIVL